jgi:hypothetical protein
MGMQFNVRLCSAVLDLAFQPAGVMRVLEVESLLHMCHGPPAIRNID